MYIKGQESLEKKGDWKVPHYKIVLLFFWSIPTLAYLWYGIFILRVFKLNNSTSGIGREKVTRRPRIIISIVTAL